MDMEDRNNPIRLNTANASDSPQAPGMAILTQLQAVAPDHRMLAYKNAIDQVAILAFTDPSGRIIDANDHFCRISEFSREELIGAHHRILNSGHHHPAFFRHMWRTISSGQIWRSEICNRTKSGKLYWVDTTIAPQFDTVGKICGYVSVRLDITARKLAEAQAKDENLKRRDMEALLDDIVDTLPNGIVAYDHEDRIIFVNKANREIYGDLAPRTEIGCHRNDVFAHSNMEALRPQEDEDSFNYNPTGCQQSIIQYLPGDRWIQVQNRRSTSGTLVSVQTDVSQLKRVEKQIKQQAERDFLTGVFNRHALFNRLTKLFQSPADTAPQTCTLVLIDLDGFKAINDRMGHVAGDTLLRQVAENFQNAVRQGDMVARLGGDEFAILLPHAHTERDITRIMEKLTSALDTPVRIGQQKITASASMGVASFPHDGKTPEELIKSADLALYQCKQNGRGAYALYDLSMRRLRKRRETLTAKLRTALTRDQISVVLQPQLNMSTGRHTGFEALVRWKVGRGWIPPLELISIAEEAGLVTQLSYQIMDKAFAIFARLKAITTDPGTIAFNVVAAQLHKPDFANSLMGLLDKHGITPDEVEIEVTENVILDRSADHIARVLRNLHSKGMSIALDDFGTGYASLTHLKQFPLDRLKIDRSFISGIMDEKDDQIIVRTIISLAHSLGLQVVAEGIETKEQYQELSNLGCDLAQGYLIGRPMDEDAISAYLKQYENGVGANIWA